MIGVPATGRLLCSVLLISVTATALAGCGRRGAPRPPEDVRPQTILDLRAQPGDGGIKLSWGRPEAYIDGSRMRDLGYFEVQRASGESHAFERIERIEVTDRDRFRQLRRFTYEDRNVDRGRRYRYRVISSTTDRYVSAPSNEVEATLPEVE